MKILASDYDGTLRTGVCVSKENVDAIRAFRACGNAFGIVTGRSVETIRQEIEKNHLEVDFLVTNNGGIICDQEYRSIKKNTMDFDKAMELVSYIRTLPCEFFSIGDGFRRLRIYVDGKQEAHTADPRLDLTWEELQEKRQIVQIVVFLHDQKRAEEITDHIHHAFASHVSAYQNVGCIDIAPALVSKSSGLNFVKEWKGYRHEDIYAIGDSFNDISMIDEFHGLCVSHASSQIKEHAESVVDTVSDAIAHLMQISS